MPIKQKLISFCFIGIPLTTFCIIFCMGCFFMSLFFIFPYELHRCDCVFICGVITRRCLSPEEARCLRKHALHLLHVLIATLGTDMSKRQQHHHYKEEACLFMPNHDAKVIEDCNTNGMNET